MIQKIKQFILSNKKLRKAIIRTIRNQQISTFKISNFPVNGYFEKDNGEKLSLHTNLRSFIVPGWEKHFQQNFKDGVEVNTSFDTDLSLAVEEYKLFFTYFEKTVMSLNFSLKDKRMLEIGSGNTLLSHLMADTFKDTEVVSTDIDSYYENINKDNDIKLARTKVANNFSKNVVFESDSITNSKFADESFDVIFSNTVLEHIDDIETAFKEMKRILKPGGFCYHFYNPFFSYNGAHTVCATDHPWGHCMLSEQEYNRYSDTIYPKFTEASKAFFKNDLNKKSLNEFLEAIEFVNFSSVTFLRETNFNLMQLLLPNTLSNVKSIYPHVTLEDLLTTSVIVVLQK